MRSLNQSSSFALRLRHCLRSFWQEKDGAIAAYVAVSMTTLISAAGLYVDLSNTTRIRNEYQVALDNALVAAARRDDSADRTQRAQEMFLLSLSDSARAALNGGGAHITSDGKYLTGEVVGGVDQNFRFIFGQPTVNVRAESTVAIASAQRRQADFVFVIDSTGSMGGTIQAVKNNATSFQTNFNNYLTAHSMDPLEGMRIRVVFFKDYFAERNGHPGNSCGTASLASAPIYASRFFSVDIPSERTDFLDFVSGQKACQGGDAAEYGLEAINDAMNSPWARPGDLLAGPAFNGDPVSATNTIEAIFPIIVLWTDITAYPLPPDPRVLPPTNATYTYKYPSSTIMPYSYGDFNAKWSNPLVIDQANKLIITFVNPVSFQMSSDANHIKQNGYYYTIKDWASHERGGTLTEGNTKMVELIADAVMKKMVVPSIVR